MMILSQYHIFELDTINIYSAVCVMEIFEKSKFQYQMKEGKQ